MAYGIRFFLLLTLVAGVLSPGRGGVLAQEALSDDARALLDELNVAINALSEISGLSSEGTLVTEQLITASAGGTAQVLRQTLTQNMLASFNQQDEPSAILQLVQTVQSQTDNQSPVTIEQSMEFVLLGEDIFIRFTEIEPDFLRAQFPEEWVNLAEEPNAFPGAELINVEQLVDSARSQVSIPLTEDTVLSIQKEPFENEDGETLQRYDVEINGVALYASEGASQLLNAFDFEQLGFNRAELISLFGAGTTVTYQIYVDDAGVRQIDSLVVSVVDMAPSMDASFGVDELILDQTVTSSFTFSDFGVVFDIQAPQAGE